MNRRRFLYSGMILLLSSLPAKAFKFLPQGIKPDKSGLDDITGHVFKKDAPDRIWKWATEGYTYTTLTSNKVQCNVCPNECVLSPGDRSICRSKVNSGGVLYSLTYGNPCAINIDPVEKKPLFHFKPRSKALSIATAGCNFRCLNCQNWEISQAKPHEVRHSELFPADVVREAEKAKADAIAYTYSEAITFFEYMIETAHLARKKNIYNLWISNGYINQAPLSDLCQVIDGANVNLKAFSDSIYKKLNGGKLQPVLETFKTLHQKNVHFEITNLVVPGYTDDIEMVKNMCGWILKNTGPDHPLHFSRFFPKYKLDRLSPTPVSTLESFRKIAMDEGIRYVYIGNIPGHEGNNTFCHHCKKLIIQRNGYHISKNNINKGTCRFCNTAIPGVW